MSFVTASWTNTRGQVKLVKNIQIDTKTLAKIKESLIDSHKEEKEYHKKEIKKLNIKYTKLQNRVHQIYIDKLDGNVTNARLVKYLLSNCTLDNGSLCPTYRKPFNLLAKGPDCIKWGPPPPSSKKTSLNSTVIL